MSPPRPAWRLTAVVVVTLVGGCSATTSIPITRRLHVGAQPFALAEVARRVGLDRVVVADEGQVTLTPGTNPDPWLDPVAMEAVAQQVANELSAADPAGRSAYQLAATVYEAQLEALDISYRRGLADCVRAEIVTADKVFATMGARYGFTDHAATDPGTAALIEAKGIPVVFTEPGVATAPALALAQATHTKVGLLDTLTLRTPTEEARNESYLAIMTDNLANLTSAMACTSA